jgi:hypothetical protein
VPLINSGEIGGGTSRPRFLFVNRQLVVKCPASQRKSSMDKRQENYAQRWWTVMLRDPHWWVPVIVLVGGLILLEWIR